MRGAPEEQSRNFFFGFQSSIPAIHRSQCQVATCVAIGAGSGIRRLSKFEPFDRPAHAHSCADQKLGRTAETQVAASAGP